MNWYSVFYWISVADNVSMFLQVIAVIFMIFFIFSAIGFFVSANAKAENSYNQEREDYKQWSVWHTAWKRVFQWSLIISLTMGTLWVFIPSKKNCLLIVTGGTVGNFIASDSSAKAIPAEAMNLLREKIRQEVEEIKNPLSSQNLQDMTKDELIKLLKEKK